MRNDNLKRAALAGTALAAAGAGWALLAGAVGAQSPAGGPTGDAHPGAAIYGQNCGVCHNNGEQLRAPSLANLHQLPASQIRFALTEGVMKAQGAGLSAEQKEQVVAWLAAPAPPAAVAAAKAEATGPSSAAPAQHGAGNRQPPAKVTAAADSNWTEPLMCAADRRGVDLGGRPTIAMAGVTLNNARALSAAQAGLKTSQLSDLEVAWTLAVPGASGLRVTPVIVGSTMFYAVPNPGMLLALDTRTGCIKWAKPSAAPYRSSPAFGMAGRRPALFIGDQLGALRALDPATGEEIWKTDPRHTKEATMTGGPMVFGDKIIVPISVLDVARAGDPNYECCKLHGAVSAVDAATGKVLWIAHTMEDAKPLGRKNSKGVEMYGPSGAPIWSTPAIDVKRGLVYAATGENTSPPNTKTSDAIMALDLKTGERKWVFQAMERDIWNMSCRGPTNSGPNCFFMANDESVLKDYDFGAGAIVAKKPQGRGDIILAGQKSGAVWALDPDKGGAVLWQKRFGEGTALGGVHWGIASDGRRVFAPISDPGVAPEKSAAGLYALNIGTGEVAWSFKAEPDCGNGRGPKVSGCQVRYGLSAAPLVVDGGLVTGSLDGKVRIFDAATGRVLWSYDTIREFPAVNGGAVGKGGSIDSQSIAAGDGMVFVGSGYGQFNQQAGNVLIAFKPRAGAVRTARR